MDFPPAELQDSMYQFIDGELAHGSSGEHIALENPSNGEHIDDIALGDSAATAGAVD